MHRVHENRVDRHAELAVERVLELDRLVHRHLLGERHGEHAGLRGSRRNASIRSAWRPTGPTRAMLAYVLGARSIARPWPVAGASTIARSNAGVPARGSSWARSHTFPIVTSSVSPGAAAVRYWNRLLPPSARQRARLQLVAEPLALGLLRVHGHGRQLRHEPRHAVAAGHLAQHHALAVARRGEAERDRQGRLTGPSLARHDDEPLVQ